MTVLVGLLALTASVCLYFWLRKRALATHKCTHCGYEKPTGAICRQCHAQLEPEQVSDAVQVQRAKMQELLDNIKEGQYVFLKHEATELPVGLRQWHGDKAIHKPMGCSCNPKSLGQITSIQRADGWIWVTVTKDGDVNSFDINLATVQNYVINPCVTT